MRIIDLIILVLFLLSFSIYITFAWREPGGSPPSGSGVLQGTDSGDLIVTGNLNVNFSSNITGNEFIGGKLEVGGPLKVGSAASPKGITLYSIDTFSPYCLKISASPTPAIQLVSGECQ